ncbi:Heat shock protein 4L [Armadillidium nasatum]|uniref:Heat shock protein 4L n=1 Tax=Armadillidium nasatum TaxID=96803 RepID=A0A5N5SP35_9CRUS|nr:Heat shock protein 4L [Armadillidium nasatum]
MITVPNFRSCVAFGEKTRILGVAAKNQMLTNMKNTCVNFKRLIGKTYRDSRVQDELKLLPYKVFEEKDGSIGISVRYLNEEHIFSVTQITAMLFTKLKHTAEAALGIKVADVVIGVPCFMDDAGRHAMLEAATCAGLNVLRLMNETTAVALAYGIYKQDLPSPEEKPRNVIFVDCGHANLQVSAVAFNRGKLKMLMTTSDEHMGGRDFDVLLGRHFANEFKSKYKIDALSNQRAWHRLLSDVEKLKKQMSANSTELPMNIECFMDDKDVSGKMKRTVMEELSTAPLRRVEKTLTQCLSECGLKLEDIYSVEIVGGSSRIPAIKQIIEKVFKKIPSTTLNADEAVARGCALQCAILSPAFKVSSVNCLITDVQPYSINLLWSDESGHEADMEVFPRNHQIPFSKILTFYRKEPFSLQAQYARPSPSPDPVIGHFTIEDITPTADGENQKVKVKVRVNIHGLFTVSSATLTEKREVIEEDNPSAAMETDEKVLCKLTIFLFHKSNENDQQEMSDKENVNEKDSTNAEQKMETDKTEAKDSAKAEGGEKKVKRVSKTIDLGVTARVRSLPQSELNSLIEFESQMVQNDKLENDRINAKNAVEEYVYDMRGRIHDELEKYINDSDREKYSSLLNDTENWLYEDGEDCSKQVYIDKLAELKQYGEPVKVRKREREELPSAFELLMLSVQIASKVVENFKAGDEKFNHLDGAEIEKVEKAISDRQRWVDQNMGALSVTPTDKDLPITAQQVRSEKATFEALVNPIINKPKPKPKAEDPPPQEDSQNKDGNPTSNGPCKDNSNENNDTNTTESERKPEEPMDVD